MLFGSPSIATFSRSNLVIWNILALQAGALNLGGFLACHAFVSHLTGFASEVGDALGRGALLEAGRFALVPGAFLAGSIACAALVDRPAADSGEPRYVEAFGVMFALSTGVLVTGAAGLWGPFGAIPDEPRREVLVGVLCAACGFQNALVTTASRAVVRTTHLTGIVTDLGVGIVRVLRRDPLDPAAEGQANRMRIGLVLSFVAGSALAAVLFRRLHYGGFALPGATSGALFASTAWVRLRGPARPR